MAGFLPSALALKRVVVGLGSELAPILSLEMAAGDVWVSRSKHATRKPVKVHISCPNCVSAFAFLLVLACLKSAFIALIESVITAISSRLRTDLVIHLIQMRRCSLML